MTRNFNRHPFLSAQRRESPALVGADPSVDGHKSALADQAGANIPRGGGGGGALPNQNASGAVRGSEKATPDGNLGSSAPDAALQEDADRSFDFVMNPESHGLGGTGMDVFGRWFKEQTSTQIIEQAEESGLRVLRQAEKNPESLVELSDMLKIDEKTHSEIVDEMTAQAFDRIDYEESNADITSEQAKKKKKIVTKLFGGLTRQELGLFLFEFGSHTLMNRSRGIGAIGAGGIGALSSLQERRRYAEQAEIEAKERSRKADIEERTTTVAENKAALDQEKFEAMYGEGGTERKGPALEETAEGFVYWKEGEGWVDARRSDGTLIKSPGSGEVKWQSQYLANFYRGLGYSEAEIGRILAGGPDNTELINDNINRIHSEVEAIRKSESEFAAGVGKRKMATIPDENGEPIQKPYAELTDMDIVRMATHTAEQSLRSAEALRTAQRRKQTLNRVRKESGVE